MRYTPDPPWIGKGRDDDEPEAMDIETIALSQYEDDDHWEAVAQYELELEYTWI